MSGEQKKAVKRGQKGAFLARGCSALTKAGEPCRWPAIRFTELCAVHTPGMHDANARKGGNSRRNGRWPPLQYLPGPTSPAESMAMLSQMLAEVRVGKLDPQVAQAAKGLHYAYLRAFEDHIIVTELAKLEKQLGLEVASTLPEERVLDETAG
jgi:hypothetical protein